MIRALARRSAGSAVRAWRSECAKKAVPQNSAPQQQATAVHCTKCAKAPEVRCTLRAACTHWNMRWPLAAPGCCWQVASSRLRRETAAAGFFPFSFSSVGATRMARSVFVGAAEPAIVVS